MITPQEEYLSAKARLTKAKAAYSAAESELIHAERQLRDASRLWELHQSSNEYIKRLSVPS